MLSMFSFDLSLFVDSALIFILAFLIDIVFGEYPDRIHPTIGIGKIISYLKPKLKNPNPKIEKANGVLLAITVMLIAALPVFLVLFWLRQSFGIYGQIAYIIVGAVLFKATFAIRGMGQYTKPIAAALEEERFGGSPTLAAIHRSQRPKHPKRETDHFRRS